MTRVKLFLSVVAFAAGSGGAAASYCPLPLAPACARSFAPFAKMVGEGDCRSKVKAYGDAVERYAACVSAEAQARVDAARSDWARSARRLDARAAD